MSTVTFIQAGQKKVVEAADGKTILQITLDAGIPMEHACGGNGFCTTCLCKIKEGSDHVSPKNDREEAMGLEGEDRLGCQAVIHGNATVEVVEM